MAVTVNLCRDGASETEKHGRCRLRINVARWKMNYTGGGLVPADLEGPLALGLYKYYYIKFRDEF